MSFSIGELSASTGVKIPTIRYYEQISLLPEGRRDRGNRRRYDQSAFERLQFIRHARDMGFSIQSIRELIRISQSPKSSCQQADGIAQAHLVDVRRRIQKLQALELELSRMIHECKHGGIVHCRILSVLSDHSQCSSEHDVYPKSPGASV